MYAVLAHWPETPWRVANVELLDNLPDAHQAELVARECRRLGATLAPVMPQAQARRMYQRDPLGQALRNAELQDV